MFAKRLSSLAVGKLLAVDFEIEVGAMDYGFEINGIIGLDFLLSVGAIVDLKALEVRAH